MTTLKKTADDIRNLHSNAAQLPALDEQVAHWAAWPGDLRMLAMDIADWVVAHTASHKPSQGYTNLFKPDYDRLAEIHTILVVLLETEINEARSNFQGQALISEYERLVSECKNDAGEWHTDKYELNRQKAISMIRLSTSIEEIADLLYAYLELNMPPQYDDGHKSLLQKLSYYVAKDYDWKALTNHKIWLVLGKFETKVLDQNCKRLDLLR